MWEFAAVRVNLYRTYTTSPVREKNCASVRDSIFSVAASKYFKIVVFYVDREQSCHTWDRCDISEHFNHGEDSGNETDGPWLLSAKKSVEENVQFWHDSSFKLKMWALQNKIRAGHLFEDDSAILKESLQPTAARIIVNQDKRQCYAMLKWTVEYKLWIITDACKADEALCEIRAITFSAEAGWFGANRCGPHNDQWL